MYESGIKERYELLEPFLDERIKRLVVAAEAETLGYGGVSAVAQATGVSRQTITDGQKELKKGGHIASSTRIRKAGGGRKRITQKYPALKRELRKLLESTTRGDPQSPLLWTCKSVRNLSAALTQKGYPVSHTVVSRLLVEMDYSLQANVKTHEGTEENPDRNAQFEYINAKIKTFQASQDPVISIDCKKKESIGHFKNAGREYHPIGKPEEVDTHDFPDEELGKVSPYGVYDLTENKGWVSVGVSHDTAAFAINTIRHWWSSMGSVRYPQATRLLITADSGGSNGYRLRLWKVELQKLANELGLAVSVCHLPPGTSKWNKIEHRLFSFITQNWRGRPLISHEVVVNLIAATTTQKGLHVECQLDKNRYETGIQVSDKALRAVQITKDSFHGEWNYTIHPENNLTS